MLKRISGFFIAVMFTTAVFISSFMAVSADTYKNWLQSDSRWRYKTLGGSGDTMAEIGCAVTAVAIQVVHSGSKSESEFNPGILVDYLNKSGGLDSEGNLYWGAVTGLASSFTFEKRAYLSSQTKSSIIKELTGYINSGYYIVLSVEYDGHWVAIDTISNGTVYMMDPAQNKTNDLFNYYSASGMLQVRLFKGKNTPPKVTSTTAPTETLPPTTNYLTGHYKTTDPLNLRESYSTSSDALLTIPEGEEIVVTRVYNNSWGETEYNGKSGWVYMGYTIYTENDHTYKDGKYKCIADGGVNMRSGIGTDKSIVCLIPENATVTISTVSHNWGKATYDSYTGYICMEFLEYVSGSAVTTTAATTTTKPVTTTTKAAATTTTTIAATTTAATTTTKAVTTTITTSAATTTAVTTTTKPVTTTTKAATTTASTAAATTTAATTTTKPVTTTTKAATTTTTTAAATTTAVTTATKPVTTTTKAATTTASTAAATTTAVTTTTKAVTTTAANSTTTPVTGITPATTVSILIGDVNRDGKLDKDDVLKLNLYIINPVKIDIITSYIYDINLDGYINEMDVVYLMKKIKKLGANTK